MTKTDKTVECRALLLSQLIITNADLYQASQQPEQKILEMVIGDAVRYLPQIPELFSGKISIQAFEKMQVKAKSDRFIEFCVTPRSVLARLLFTQYLEELIKNPLALISLYYDHLGKYHVILSEEARLLRRLQRSTEFIDEEKTYEKAGIEWVDFSYEAYQEFKRRSREKGRNHDFFREKL